MSRKKPRCWPNRPDSSGADGAPTLVEEALPGRKENFVSQQADQDDDKHDADHLFHRLLLASEMQQLAEPEAGEDGDIDFSCHQRPPGESPSLLYPADDERQRPWKEHV